MAKGKTVAPQSPPRPWEGLPLETESEEEASILNRGGGFGICIPTEAFALSMPFLFPAKIIFLPVFMTVPIKKHRRCYEIAGRSGTPFFLTFLPYTLFFFKNATFAKRQLSKLSKKHLLSIQDNSFANADYLGGRGAGGLKKKDLQDVHERRIHLASFLHFVCFFFFLGGWKREEGWGGEEREREGSGVFVGKGAKKKKREICIFGVVFFLFVIPSQPSSPTFYSKVDNEKSKGILQKALIHSYSLRPPKT